MYATKCPKYNICHILPNSWIWLNNAFPCMCASLTLTVYLLGEEPQYTKKVNNLIRFGHMHSTNDTQNDTQ